MHLTVRHGSRDLAGVVRAGESLDQAARRVAATVPGEPFAVDLSADPVRFGIDPDQVVVLRPMTHGDLPVVATWRRSEHVARWWSDAREATDERVTGQYGPDIDGRTGRRLWVAEANGRSVGFVQDYQIRDHPEFALLAPDPEAIGLDYAIGDEFGTGRGLGTRILWAWLLRTRHRFPDASSCFAAPDHRNVASRRVLAKVGFTEGVWFDEPRADGSTATVVGCSLDLRRVLG